jgi:DNA-binding response OmpR family regulator/signal transduction histidine kinase
MVQPSIIARHQREQLRRMRWWILTGVIGAVAAYSVMLLLHERHNGISEHERWHLGLLVIGTLVAFAVALASTRREMMLADTRTGFVAGVSHELRMPLAQILLAAETLALQREDSAAARVSLTESIVRETRRLMGLVDNVLLFSRSGVVGLRPAIHPVNVEELFERVRDAVRLVAMDAGRDVTAHGSATIAVMGDLSLLTQALMNLVDNAIKYDSTGNDVRLLAEAFGASVRLVVEDHGPGIPVEDRDRVFAAYERLDRDRLSERTGSGLGLAVVRTIAESLGGRVWLEETPGGGTRAVLSFRDERGHVTAILVIEDNRDYAATLGANLRREGYDVALAHTGVDGLEQARRDPADLIILDLMLPSMNGYTVLQRLRDSGVGAPVLIMTALGTEEEKLRGFALGADDYVVKPCGLLEMLARVRALLRRGPSPVATSRLVAFGPLQVDLDAREVRRGAEVVPLRPKEFDLLAALLRHRGRVVSRAELLREVWGYAAGTESRTVETHLAALRQRLGVDGSRLIVTVRGALYRVD